MIFLSWEVAWFFFVPRGCMIFFVLRGCVIFCPKRLRDFFGPKKLCDFFVQRGCVISTVVTGPYFYRFWFRFLNWLRLSCGSGSGSRIDSDDLAVPVLELNQIFLRFRVWFYMNFAHSSSFLLLCQFQFFHLVLIRWYMYKQLPQLSEFLSLNSYILQI